MDSRLAFTRAEVGASGRRLMQSRYIGLVWRDDFIVELLVWPHYVFMSRFVDIYRVLFTTASAFIPQRLCAADRVF